MILYDYLPFGAIPKYYGPGFFWDWSSKQFIKSKRQAFIVPMQTFSQPLVEDLIREIYQIASTYTNHKCICVYNDCLMAYPVRTGWLGRTGLEVMAEVTFGIGLFEEVGYMDEEFLLPFHLPFTFSKSRIPELITDIKRHGYKGKIKMSGDLIK